MHKSCTARCMKFLVYSASICFAENIFLIFHLLDCLRKLVNAKKCLGNVLCKTNGAIVFFLDLHLADTSIATIANVNFSSTMLNFTCDGVQSLEPCSAPSHSVYISLAFGSTSIGDYGRNTCDLNLAWWCRCCMVLGDDGGGGVICGDSSGNSIYSGG